MIRKRVNACIEPDLWKEAQMNDVSWTRALETGVKLLLGSSNEKKIIKEKLKTLHIQAEFYSQRLTELEKEEVEKKMLEENARIIAKEREKFLKDHRPSFKVAARILEREKYSFGSVYEHWKKINAVHEEKFGDSFRQDDFIQICREMNNAAGKP
jgi:hypothetical protein